MARCAYQNAEWLSAVYTMIDDVCARDGAPPPGAFGSLTRLVDGARSNARNDAFLLRADDMLVALHRLRLAIRQRSPATAPAAIREELRRMCKDWIGAARFC